MYRCVLLNEAAARKPGACKHASRVCQKPSLDGFQYCQKHIFDDINAPFKVCGYVYPINGKKCTQPAPKGDRKEGGFCAIHAKKSQLLRQKAGGRHCPPQTIENLLSSLAHYAPSSSTELPGEEESDNNVQCVKNPFVGIDANKVNSCGNRILDYVSESDSDVEPTTLDSVWKDADRDSSDAESIDSHEEDPLKHAGVYTAEEVAGITREKLIRLKALYVEQLKRLHHILKEKKRKYHYNLLKEKETLASIHSQSKTSPKELKLYEKLKALNRFHKHSGLEAVMHHKIKEKRNQAKKMRKFKRSRLLDPTSEVTAAPTVKCTFSIGGVKCGLKTLPSSKFCRKHILHDPHQVLFRQCGCERAEVVCQEPTLDVFEKASCMLHVTIPPLPQFNFKGLKAVGYKDWAHL
ncbi:KAT8 regulatory NSL complex subunit 2 isoform X2 [Nilaparvata lugens]|uniref:KAT8 regulatory NSL complex subunit 2 isoform X2 n=1 Tax=Nilaparvata lugens TaxID=108931 RepID=UPI00193C9B56|nr:KAT8 regulatory NSL complex subunit 2 isoform X2 [Nilaparvata lugens]